MGSFGLAQHRDPEANRQHTASFHCIPPLLRLVHSFDSSPPLSPSPAASLPPSFLAINTRSHALGICEEQTSLPELQGQLPVPHHGRRIRRSFRGPPSSSNFNHFKHLGHDTECLAVRYFGFQHRLKPSIRYSSFGLRGTSRSLYELTTEKLGGNC
jgi:hypothetical protein